MIDFKLRKMMECKKEKKLSCVKLIDEIVGIANKARSHGVLALEDLIPGYDDYLLRTGLSLMVDGIDGETNREIMDTIITASGKTGAALMRQMIIRDGVLAIQNGENPRLIKIKLDAYLGEDILGMRKEEEDIDYLSDAEIYALPYAESDGELSGEKQNGDFTFDDLVRLRPTCIQRVLQQTDHRSIAIALSSAGDKVRRYVFSNLSKRTGRIIKEDIKYMGCLRKVDVEEAQQDILDIVRVLSETGDIIL